MLNILLTKKIDEHLMQKFLLIILVIVFLVCSRKLGGAGGMNLV